MMNILALSLVLTSLATAGILSPPPQQQEINKNVIVEDGHRVVVVEYEKDIGKTKISISPQEYSDPEQNQNIPAENEENTKNKNNNRHGSFPHWATAPRELVCDAFGKCKEKVAGAFERTRGAASDAAEKVSEAEEAVAEGIERAKGRAAEIGHGAKEKAEEAVKEAARKAKEEVERVKGVKEDVERNASRRMEEMKREASKRAKEVGEMAREAKDSFKDNIVKYARQAFGMANLLGVTIAYGMCVWVTFVSSYVLARALPRQQFAIVQSKIYPVYFRAMAYCIGTGLIGHMLMNQNHNGGKFMGFNLLFSLITVLVNMLYLEPRATKVMFERMKLEKEEGRGKGGTNSEPATIHQTSDVSTGSGPTGATNRKTATTTTKIVTTEEKQEERSNNADIIKLSRILKKLNSYSSYLNVVTLMSLTLYIANLGQRLQTSC